MVSIYMVFAGTTEGVCFSASASKNKLLDHQKYEVIVYADRRHEEVLAVVPAKETAEEMANAIEAATGLKLDIYLYDSMTANYDYITSYEIK